MNHRVTSGVCWSVFALSALGSTLAHSAQPEPGPGMQESGFYLNAGIGRSRAEGCDRAYAVGFRGECDDKDTTYHLGAGYQFNRYLAAEVGYGTGELKLNGAFPPVPYTAKVETDIFEVVGLAMFPIPQMPQLSVYAKGGLFYFDTDASSNFGGRTASGNASGTDVTYGLGAQYRFTRNWSARVEWQRYSDIGSGSALGKANVDVARATVQFRF